MGKTKDIPFSKEVENLMKLYMIDPDDDFDIYKTAADMAFTTKGAISVLKNLLFRPHGRANGNSMLTITTDMALARAIISLEKELKEKKGNDN